MSPSSNSTPHDELHLTTERFELHLRRGPGGWTQETRTLRQPHVLDAAAQPAPVAAETLRDEGEVAGLASIRAPMVGTFYRAPKPGAPPFVEVGGEVGEFTVVGIIETMKLMNAINAGLAGRNSRNTRARRPARRSRPDSHAREAAGMNIRRLFVANRGEIAVRVSAPAATSASRPFSAPRKRISIRFPPALPITSSASGRRGRARATSTPRRSSRPPCARGRTRSIRAMAFSRRTSPSPAPRGSAASCSSGRRRPIWRRSATSSAPALARPKPACRSRRAAPSTAPRRRGRSLGRSAIRCWSRRSGAAGGAA